MTEVTQLILRSCLCCLLGLEVVEGLYMHGVLSTGTHAALESRVASIVATILV